MRARKGAVEVHLLWARASGHISTQETGARCLCGRPPFEVTTLQRISCTPMCGTARNHPIVIVGTWFGRAPTMSAGRVVDGIRKATNKYLRLNFEMRFPARSIRKVKPHCLECQERIFHPHQFAGPANKWTTSPPRSTSGSRLRHSGFLSSGALVPHTMWCSVGNQVPSR